MPRQGWKQALWPDGRGLMWRVANVALLALALVAACAVIVGVFFGITLLASHGN